MVRGFQYARERSAGGIACQEMPQSRGTEAHAATSEEDAAIRGSGSVKNVRHASLFVCLPVQTSFHDTSYKCITLHRKEER